MNYKYLIAISTNPYENLALEHCLINSVTKDTGILFLWQNDNTIVCGRNQDIYSECLVDEFLKQNGKIVRRCSGGGTVYHDLGTLNCSLITHSSHNESESCINLIIKALEELKITAEFNQKNDLVIANKKISGCANYQVKEKLCQHSSILINTDLEKIGHYLTPEKTKLKRNFVSSVRSRVMNLSEICPNLTVDMMMKTMLSILCAEPFDDKIDTLSLEKMIKFFQNDKWIYGGNV